MTVISDFFREAVSENLEEKLYLALVQKHIIIFTLCNLKYFPMP